MKKPYILIGCIITFLCASVYANKTDKTDPIIKTVESYIKRMNALDESNSIAKVLDLYSEQYSGNTTYVNLSGAIVRKNYIKENIKTQLEDIVQDGNYSLKIKMNKVLYKSQKENAGTISALLDFESFIDSKIAEKGTILMSIIATQQKGQWKIIQNNMIRVSESKDIGDCVCHIFEKGSTQFVTELYYPAGVKYDHKFEAFRITSNQENRIVKSSGKTFVWENSSGKLILEQEELGIAKTSKQVVQLLIKKMNIETCATIIFR
ncbi:hypothetical protein [Aquimarina algiphila]|uniref:hypothetical protein n=1 Tax=Aquimarina algiphila TaxID=2047982 RepID=UPI00232F3161|nr:hypothetical protein [Aquimarina algiphila]